jgi:hypothetical protein
VQWIDADDTLDPDKIALQVAALEGAPGDAIAYGDWSVHRIAPGKPDVVQHFAPGQEVEHVARTLAGDWYPPHLYLLRRDAAERLQAEQAWWPTQTIATDVEYSACAALLGLRFRYVTGAHVRYNIWSDAQLTSATPRCQRVAALSAIFQRLQRLVESGRAGVTLTAQHRSLLDQDWIVARLPRASVTFVRLSDGRFALRRRHDGRRIELSRKEAIVARWLMATAYTAIPMHQALAIAADIPEFATEHAVIVQAIARLRREGFLETVAP